MSEVRKKKQFGTPFKKGVSGNPSGAAAHNHFLKKVRRLTANEVAECGSLILNKTYRQLKAMLEDSKNYPDSKLSALNTWITTVTLKGIAKGDAHSLDTILNRLIGRSKETIELTGKGGGPIRTEVSQMTKAERMAELKRLSKMRKDAGND